MKPIFVGLGSNLHQPYQQLKRAIFTLQHNPEWRLLQQSPFYKTAPVGVLDQPNFVNAVVCIESALQPLELLARLQDIEQQYGRKHIQRWGPRILDLDLLCYGNYRLKSNKLVLPHPEMMRRAFVLYPLADIAPQWILPDGISVQEAKMNIIHGMQQAGESLPQCFES